MKNGMPKCDFFSKSSSGVWGRGGVGTVLCGCDFPSWVSNNPYVDFSLCTHGIISTPSHPDLAIEQTGATHCDTQWCSSLITVTVLSHLCWQILMAPPSPSSLLLRLSSTWAKVWPSMPFSPWHPAVLWRCLPVSLTSPFGSGCCLCFTHVPPF